MDRPVIRKTINNPLKAYLYAIFILHDTCLSISRFAYAPEPNRQRAGLYLRRFEVNTRKKRVALVRNAIRRFGTEAIKRAIDDKTGIPREMDFMDALQLEVLAHSSFKSKYLNVRNTRYLP